MFIFYIVGGLVVSLLITVGVISVIKFFTKSPQPKEGENNGQ